MKVFFSPVGTADPITQLGDGPMLNIVRHYAPEFIYLFLSPGMAANEEEDHRYTRAVAMLSEYLGRKAPEVRLIVSTHEAVWQFDHYIQEYENFFKRIKEDHPEAEILVNASSGTPQMEQALVSLGAFGALELKLLQVRTPKQGVHAGEDREPQESYDLDFMWELNLESGNNDGRIDEIKSPNFELRLQLRNILLLVERYEYSAASKIASSCSLVPDNVKTLIIAADERLHLVTFDKACKAFGGTGLSCRPNDSLWEYLYVMEVKLKQGKYDDFIRSLTPALTVIMEDELQQYLPKSKYLKKDKSGKFTSEINVNTVKSDKKLNKILSSGPNSKIPKYVNNSLLIKLLEEYFSGDSDRLMLIKNLRKVEERCRHKLAHDLIRSDKKKIDELAKPMSLNDIMDALFTLHGSMEPGLYDRINDRIVELIAE